jgi:hypothetical protein
MSGSPFAISHLLLLEEVIDVGAKWSRCRERSGQWRTLRTNPLSAARDLRTGSPSKGSCAFLVPQEWHDVNVGGSSRERLLAKINKGIASTPALLARQFATWDIATYRGAKNTPCRVNYSCEISKSDKRRVQPKLGRLHAAEVFAPGREWLEITQSTRDC